MICNDYRYKHEMVLEGKRRKRNLKAVSLFTELEPNISRFGRIKKIKYIKNIFRLIQ